MKTRFPPEPNGYLHLGHLKAMMIDFDQRAECILRMDDTNPETETQEFVDGIVEDVKWLGFKYSKLTYTSDYFQQLYDFAIELIKMGLAYVDFSTGDEIRDMRHSGTPSKYRNASVEDNLKFFDLMKNGEYDESKAVLRLKIDITHDNHSLRDPIAYRIKYSPHYRTGNAWCIYPSYDFSHGLVDALEEITDSFCTMEFFIRRELYYWPVLKLKDRVTLVVGVILVDGITYVGEETTLVPATVVEFGRLNVEGVLLSKREIAPLIKSGAVIGYDDPRLYTIRGLKRRGFTPEILKNIVSRSKMNRSPTTLEQAVIDFELRDYLDKNCKRYFAVIDPISVTINESETLYKSCNHPNHPVLDLGMHSTILTNDLYIERSDYRDKDSPDYYRLAPGKTVRLKYADFISLDANYDSSNGSPIVVDYSTDHKSKVKGVIHWLSKQDSHPAIFELYETDKITTLNGFVETCALKSLNESNTYEVFQFERLGYFKLDRYVSVNSILTPVFIRIIDLANKH